MQKNTIFVENSWQKLNFNWENGINQLKTKIFYICNSYVSRLIFSSKIYTFSFY